jgi:hypothetical protein
MWKITAIGASLAIFAVACASVQDQAAQAQDCSAGKPGDELSYDEANVVYNCIAADLHAGYKQGPKRWVNPDTVANYRSWTQASTKPANPGWHTERFLMTWVNDVGAAEYLKYAENPTIPAGTVIAKESFSVDANGKPVKGPLFLMEKAAAGASPKTDDWFYSMVSPKGVPQGINVFAACSECHQGNFADTGGLGYPVEEARVQ